VILGHGRVRAACWKKVTIEHDAIPNLNMDGMTMVFPPPTRTFEDNQKGTARPLHSRSHQR
jgi:Cu/Ag efflux protein CusF